MQSNKSKEKRKSGTDKKKRKNEIAKNRKKESKKLKNSAISEVKQDLRKEKLLKKDSLDRRQENILLLIDDWGWAFHHISMQIKNRLGHKYNFYIEIDEYPKSYYENKYRKIKIDQVLYFWYGKFNLFNLFPQSRKICTVFDYTYWNPQINYQKYIKNLQHIKEAIKQTDLILYSCPIIKNLIFHYLGANLIGKKIYPCLDGVDLSMFPYREYATNTTPNSKSSKSKLKVGWVGESDGTSGFYKGFLILKEALSNLDWCEFKIQSSHDLKPQKEMYRFYHQIDVIVCYSVAEGTPNPILEASACGRTWVSTSVGLVPLLQELATDSIKPGLVINRNTAELIRALRYLYENPDIMRKMGKMAHQIVRKHFSWETQIQQYDQVFSSNKITPKKERNKWFIVYQKNINHNQLGLKLEKFKESQFKKDKHEKNKHQKDKHQKDKHHRDIFQIDPEKYHVIPIPVNKFYADPFVIKKNGKNYIFCEEYDHQTRKGVIAYFVIDEDLHCSESKIILEKDYHLSYPFIFEDQGQLYMIPETYQNNCIEMYVCERFPDLWKFDRILIDQINAVDTTLWKDQGKYWLFTSIFNQGDHHNNLTIYWASQLTGPWIKHPYSENRNYQLRSAGRIFKYQGMIIRPSQETSKNIYGRRVIFNQILKLTETSFQEKIIGTMEPTWHPKISATHTFNFNEDLIVLDGYLKC